MTVVVVLLAVAVGLLALLVFGLLRTHAEILRALDRAGIHLDDNAVVSNPGGAGERDGVVGGEQGEARDLVGTVPAGGPVKVAVAGVPHFTLLAFLSSGCRTCQRFWETFAEPDLDLPGGGTRLVIVGQDPAHDSESALAELVPDGVKAVLSSAAWEDYDVPGSPYFALIDGAGGRVVGAGSALSWEQLRDLLQQSLDDAGMADRPAPSQRRPARRPVRNRAQRADAALRSAGIEPGHPSLYPPGSEPGHPSLYPPGSEPGHPRVYPPGSEPGHPRVYPEESAPDHGNGSDSAGTRADR